MGRQIEVLTLRVRLSRHNSEQDEVDNGLWRELWEEIALVIQKPQYIPISPRIE